MTGTTPPHVTGLFLTHLHYDHCMDYAYLVLSRWDQGAGQIPELEVYGPSGTARMTELLFDPQGVFDADLSGRTLHPGSEFIYEMRGGTLPRQRPAPAVTEIAPGDVVEKPEWRVTVAHAVHCQPYLQSNAYRLDAQGRSIVITGDTAPAESLTELAQGADVLVHMCHMINEVVTDPRLTSCCSGHLDAARTARDAGVTTLVLVHLTEQMEQPGMLERIICEAGGIFDGQIIVGEDLLEVPSGKIAPQIIQ
jgi:ribonuclease BN (tRNA processing enzyme)